MKYQCLIFTLMMAFVSQACALDWKESDKQLHFTVSSGISAVVYRATGSAWSSLGVCLGAGFAKELDGKFSLEDMQADAIGCGVGLAVGYLFFGDVRGLSVRF